MRMQINCILNRTLCSKTFLLYTCPPLLHNKIEKNNTLLYGSMWASGNTPFATQSNVLFCSNASFVNRNEDVLGHKNEPLLRRKGSKSFRVKASASAGTVVAPLWDTWSPDEDTPSPSFSDVLWPSLGAFAAMAMLGKIDKLLASRGVSMTIAPLGAVCALLFITPRSPAARKYNMFMAQIGCAAIGVVAFSVFGPGWLARSAALAASIAFMIYTKSTHPPAASLPLLLIDGAKFQSLNYWYALFPGAAGCILISLIQEIVCYLKDNFKF